MEASCSPGILGSCTQRSAPVPADPEGSWVLWGEGAAEPGSSGAYACASACEGCGAERVAEACAGAVDGGEASCRFLCDKGLSILYVTFAGAVRGTCATTSAACSPGDAGTCTAAGG
jgi:hypothetical protein